MPEQAAAFGEQLGSAMLYKYGLIMVRDLPAMVPSKASDGDIKVLFSHKPVVFKGDTYTDGSNVPVQCAPTLGRAVYSVVSMGERFHDSDADEYERPDPIVPTTWCGCVNATNSYHSCTKHCIEIGVTRYDDNGVSVTYKCDRSCKKPRPAQPHKRD